MKSFLSIFLFIFFLFLSSLSHRSIAADIDNFSQRHSLPPDAIVEVNKMIQWSLLEAIRESYVAEEGCDGKKIRKRLRNKLGGSFTWSKIYLLILKNPNITLQKISLKDSIYKNATFFTNPIVYFFFGEHLINLNGILIGTDKLEHLIDTGYMLFSYFHEGNHSYEKTLRYNEITETFYGKLTTFIYSYGDIVANIEGWRFWELLAYSPKDFSKISQKDPTKFLLKCESKQGRSWWALNRPLDISPFINEGMDEAINCNHYTSYGFKTSVEKNLSSLSKQFPSKTWTCPVKVEACQKLQEYYKGPLGIHALSPECLQAGQQLAKNPKKNNPTLSSHSHFSSVLFP